MRETPLNASTHDRPVVRIETRTERECEVVKSDRIELVRQANAFVESMVAKLVLPMIATSVPKEMSELSDAEYLAYDSALMFLGRQFERGYSDTETIEKRVTHSAIVEFEKPAASPTDTEATSNAHG